MSCCQAFFLTKYPSQDVDFFIYGYWPNEKQQQLKHHASSCYFFSSFLLTKLLCKITGQNLLIVIDSNKTVLHFFINDGVSVDYTWRFLWNSPFKTNGIIVVGILKDLFCETVPLKQMVL